MSVSTTPQKAAFRPQSRLISLLGEQLISDQAVGLIELVKNAYDADATNIAIQLLGLTHPATTRIIIHDNGTGMTRDDIEQKWLSPAVSHKEKQKKNRQRTPLDAMAGVSIFRDRLRVLPYGEAGNDWLDLDKERINNMSGRIGNQQIVGFIEVSQEETPGLRDKTNREGLIDTADFSNLRALVRAAINVFTTLWLQDRPDGRKRSKPRVPEPSGDSLRKATTIAEKVREKATDDVVIQIEASPLMPSISDNSDVPTSVLIPAPILQSPIEQVSAQQEVIVPTTPEINATTLVTQRQAMNQLITHLQDAASYQQKCETDTTRKEQDLMHLAATGMAAERVTHEFSRQVGAALHALQVLRRYLKAGDEAEEAIHTLEACLGTLRNELRVLAPYEAGWRAQRTTTVSVGEAARLAFMLNLDGSKIHADASKHKAVSLKLLRRLGGAYQFYHPLLRDYVTTQR